MRHLIALAFLLSACSATTTAKIEAANDAFVSQLATVTVAACQIDSQLQPVLVPLTSAVVTAVYPLATSAVAGMVALDTASIHPVIVAACKAVGGLAVAAAVKA